MSYDAIKVLVRGAVGYIGSQRFRPANSDVPALQTNFGRLGLFTGLQTRVCLREALERTIAWWRWWHKGGFIT